MSSLLRCTLMRRTTTTIRASVRSPPPLSSGQTTPHPSPAGLLAAALRRSPAAVLMTPPRMSPAACALRRLATHPGQLGRFGVSAAQKNAYCSSSSPQQRHSKLANTLLRRLWDKFGQAWRQEETRQMIMNVSVVLGLVAAVVIVGCIMKPHFEAQVDKLAQAFVLMFLLALLEAMVEMQKERRHKSLEDDHADDSGESNKKLKPTKT